MANITTNNHTSPNPNLCISPSGDLTKWPFVGPSQPRSTRVGQPSRPKRLQRPWFIPTFGMVSSNHFQSFHETAATCGGKTFFLRQTSLTDLVAQTIWNMRVHSASGALSQVSKPVSCTAVENCSWFPAAKYCKNCTMIFSAVKVRSVQGMWNQQPLHGLTSLMHVEVLCTLSMSNAQHHLPRVFPMAWTTGLSAPSLQARYLRGATRCCIHILTPVHRVG